MTAILGKCLATPRLHISNHRAHKGGLATIVASYLARARGSQEPELSITRVKDLEQFIRECEAFKLDHGHLLGSSNPQQEARLAELRDKYEELLGNGNG